MRVTAKNNTHYIKSIDTGSTITLNVYTHNGLPVDLNQYDSVEIVIGNKTGRLRTFTATLESNEGELSFDFDDDNLLPAGDYMLEIHLNESDGDVIVSPSKGHFHLNVNKSLDQVGTVINTIVLSEFEQQIDDAVANANDAATYATNQGDYAKQEADRLEGTDVSTLDQKVDDLIARIGSNNNLNTTEKGELVLAINEVLSDFNVHKVESALDDDVHGLADKVIKESGSNSDGEYIKYADGTQIAYGRFMLPYKNNNRLEGSLTFPVSFSGSPIVSINNSDEASGTNPSFDEIEGMFTLDNPHSNGVDRVGYNDSNVNFSDGDEMSCSYIAIGMWK